jgi:hypothetical protein
VSRLRSSGSYGHAIQKLGRDCYRLSWVVDRYYPDSRLRYPRTTTRDTDLAGAVRFAERWEIARPVEDCTNA